MAITAALIAGGAGLLGQGISGWASWYGMNKQEKANADAYKQNLGLAQQQNAIQEKETAKEWTWKEEERDYKRKMDSINQTFQVLSANPQAQTQMINMWSK
jgi:hypothetical protein